MMLKIKNLSGGYLKDCEILQGVDFEISKGDSIGIIGLNGCGKSTFSKAIMNILPYRSGEIYFNGENTTRKSPQELSELGITFFMQGGKVFEELSVRDNLLLACENKKNIEHIKEYFVLLQVTDKHLSRMRADTLSGGERHQLALAMCLLKNPLLLILDEPSAGLSPKAVTTMYDTLELLRGEKKLTIILVEQNVTRAIQFCDSINMLKNGKFVYYSDNKDIKKVENLMFIA
jgi:ABC-type branched-subunit amino acid transport system ATPase component